MANDTLSDAMYRVYTGKAEELMPLLAADNRRLMNVAEVMKQRVEICKKHKQPSTSYWWKMPCFTGDAILYHPDGKLKFELDSKGAATLGPDAVITRWGGEQLVDGVYESVDGPEFTRKEFARLTRVWQSTESPGQINNPLWQILARDKALLEAYLRAAKSAKTDFCRQSGGLLQGKIPFLMPTDIKYYLADQDKNVPLRWFLKLGYIDTRGLYGPTYMHCNLEDVLLLASERDIVGVRPDYDMSVLESKSLEEIDLPKQMSD